MLYVEIVIAATKTKQHSYAARSAGRAFFCLPTPVATTWQWTGTCRNAMPFANSEVHGYIVLQAMLLLKAFITATLKRYTDKKKRWYKLTSCNHCGKKRCTVKFLDIRPGPQFWTPSAWFYALFHCSLFVPTTTQAEHHTHRSWSGDPNDILSRALLTNKVLKGTLECFSFIHILEVTEQKAR